MRTPDLDKILAAMLKTYDGISDLNFSVGHPLQVEDYGELKPVYVDPPIEALTPYQTEQVALTLMLLVGCRIIGPEFSTSPRSESRFSAGKHRRDEHVAGRCGD